MRIRLPHRWGFFLGILVLFTLIVVGAEAGHIPFIAKPDLRGLWLPSGLAAVLILFVGLRRVPANGAVRPNGGSAAEFAERRRTRLTLDMYRLAALQTADHWMITDSDGVVVEVNPAFESVTGYSQDELVGKKPNVIKSNVHDREFYEHMWHVLRSGRPYKGVVVNRRKNGELFYEMKTITPVTDESGRTTHFFSIGKDITELKVAEDRLQRSALELEQANRQLMASEADLRHNIRILQSVLTSMNEGVMVADRDGRFVMFNPAGEHMVGIGSTDTDPKEWTAQYGVYLPDQTTPYPTENLPLVRAINGVTTDDAELFIRNPSKKDGVWLSVRGRPLKDEDGNIIGGVIVTRDITQDKWAEQAREELNATREEMKIAERIQGQLFPSNAPVVDGMDIGGASQAAVVTGGDLFDYVATPDGGLLLVVCDVSGHGFGPALLMATVHAYVHALIQSGVEPRDVPRIVNRLIANDTDTGEFVTLGIAHLDTKTRVCEYASAGHTTSYVLDAAGSVKHRLESTCPPLGVLPDLSCDMLSGIELADGDVLLMLTDGILEAENSDGEPFGVERTLDVLRNNRDCAAARIVEILHTTVVEHCGGRLQDDITSIILKVKP